MSGGGGGDSRGWLLVITKGRSSVPAMFHPLLDEFADIDEREKRVGVLPGTPILISPRGEIDEGLVRFFNSPHYGSLGASTRSDYAKDIRLWVSYLGSRAGPRQSRDVGRVAGRHAGEGVEAVRTRHRWRS